MGDTVQKLKLRLARWEKTLERQMARFGIDSSKSRTNLERLSEFIGVFHRQEFRLKRNLDLMSDASSDLRKASREMGRFQVLVDRAIDILEAEVEEGTSKDGNRSDWLQDVLDFHVASESYVGVGAPKEPPNDVIELRRRLIEEEAEELLEAMEKGDMPGIADGMADLIYVILGTAVSYGLNLHPVWNEVQRANLAKVTPLHKDKDGKVQKPHGWKPPNIKKVLKSNGTLIKRGK